MPVQVEQLGRAFTAETEHQFTVWWLATPDPLERVLAPGYFTRCLSRFRLGDLLVCATSQPADRLTQPLEPASRRRSMLMVTRLEPRAVEVRMVQDWGTPVAAPAAAQPPAPRARRRLGLALLAGAGQIRRPARGKKRRASAP